MIGGLRYSVSSIPDQHLKSEMVPNVLSVVCECYCQGLADVFGHFSFKTNAFFFGVKDSCHSFRVSPSSQDDMLIRVFNYNTLGRVHMFEAHHDYIRCIAVHPSQPYILTCSGREELHALYTHTHNVLVENIQLF